MNLICTQIGSKNTQNYALKIGENSILGKDLLVMKLPIDDNKSDSIIFKIWLSDDNSGSIQIVDKDYNIVFSQMCKERIQLFNLKCLGIYVVDNFLNVLSFKFTKIPHLDSFSFNFEEMENSMLLFLNNKDKMDKNKLIDESQTKNINDLNEINNLNDINDLRVDEVLEFLNNAEVVSEFVILIF